MAFTLSKVLWLIVMPGNALLLGLLLGFVLWAIGWRRTGVTVLVLSVLGLVSAAVLPTGQLLRPLEDRFPIIHQPPAHVDGIVVLGGSVSLDVSEKRQQVNFGYGERLTAFATLARRYPGAKLVFTGGSGSLILTDFREADVAKRLFGNLGMDVSKIVFERESRNTYDNAVFTKRLVHPAAGETWLLVTSAFHMPRAVGCFRKVGWAIVPYPVDYHTTGEDAFGLGFDLAGGLNALNEAVHEYVGLVAYYLMDRTDSLFPGPRSGQGGSPM
jgi:uncharacterized SAM-binding protein YcdF (DUF218 family)